MEQLNQYLQMLVSSSSYELHLEPNKNPYMVNATGQSDVATEPLLGPQISMMVFPLIPLDIKQDLPNQPQIQFVHPHNLGKFSFTIQKSPAGFNVTVRPLLGDAIVSEPVAPAAAKPVPPATNQGLDDSNLLSVESSSGGTLNSASQESPSMLNDLLVEDRESMPVIEINGGSVIEVVSANDPQFQTIFSDTSTYEPPGRRQDFETQLEAEAQLDA